MKANKLKWSSILLLSVYLVTPLISQDTIDNESLPQLPAVELSIEDAIQLVLQKNLTLLRARYDVIQSDSSYRISQKKYAVNLGVGTNYVFQNNPSTSSSTFSGNEATSYGVSANAKKKFSTGTTVSVDVAQTYNATNASGFYIGTTYVPKTPDAWIPSVQLSVQQELLKNSFGYLDRLQDDRFEDEASENRRLIIDQLSGLVVQALVDYWQVSVNIEEVTNATSELESTRQVRNIIARNIRLGLNENFELNQYNALVAGAETHLAQAKQQLIASERKLLRTVNMPPDTKVPGVTNLSEELPEIDRELAIMEALSKRVDYQIAVEALEETNRNINIAENSALPSLTAILSVTGNSRNTDIGGANGEALSLKYPSYNVGLQLSYPLWDEEIKTNLRNANLQRKQAEITAEELRVEIRDEVLDSIDQVELSYTILQNSRKAKTESERSYKKLIAKSRQGRFNSATVKSSFDVLIEARHQELQALVNFNVSLLRLQLTKNEIFENYNVDVEKLIDEVR